MSAPRVTVVPLGPGKPEALTLQAAELLRGGMPLYVRTARHPVVDWLDRQGIGWVSLDAFYDRYEDFDQMHQAMADCLLDRARSESLLYGVPDPSCDQSVRFLLEKAAAAGVSVSVVPGVTLSGCCLSACADRMENTRTVTVSAQDFATSRHDPTAALLITELDSQLLAGMIKLQLSEYLDDEAPVLFFPPSAEAVRRRLEISLCELDRQKHYDQTAAVWIPGTGYTGRKRFCFQDLEDIMARLRSRDGCPWDSAQTHASLRPYLVEEAWEAVDAIGQEDMAHLSDELGDVLLQVVFHAAIAADFDEFTITDVLTHICRKMIVRHPHLFAGAAVLPAAPAKDSCDGAGAEDSMRDWEAIKRKESGRATVGESLEDVSSALPSLRYAEKLLSKISDLPALTLNAEQLVKAVRDESGALLREDGRLNQAGMEKLLLACAGLCKSLQTDGEILLHEGALRLKEAFRSAEKAALAEGRSPDSLTPEDVLNHWENREG